MAEEGRRDQSDPGRRRGPVAVPSLRLPQDRARGVLRLAAGIGLALLVPSWWLVHHARRGLAGGGERGRTTIALNAWLAVTLLGLGVPNVPLAVPAFLNMGYHLHARRGVGWAIVSVAIVVQAGLFIGALIFMASGQTFEQFSGM